MKLPPVTKERGRVAVEETLRFGLGEGPLGAILVSASEKGIRAIFLGDDPGGLRGELRARFPKARLIEDSVSFAEPIARIIAFLESPRAGLDLVLDLRGTDFQQEVWQALRQIPSGHTASYSEIAVRIGRPTATRAVASACAANAVALGVPCHRVIRRDGGLSDYRWGAERKRELIRREHA